MYNCESIYSVQCRVYRVQCTVYIVQCKVHSVQCKVFSIQCTVYSVKCKVNPMSDLPHLYPTLAASLILSTTHSRCFWPGAGGYSGGLRRVSSRLGAVLGHVLVICIVHIESLGIFFFNNEENSIKQTKQYIHIYFPSTIFFFFFLTLISLKA